MAEFVRILATAALLSTACLSFIGGVALHDLKGVVKTAGTTVMLMNTSAAMPPARIVYPPLLAAR